jgi:hypothetical protein
MSLLTYVWQLFCHPISQLFVFWRYTVAYWREDGDFGALDESIDDDEESLIE